MKLTDVLDKFKSKPTKSLSLSKTYDFLLKSRGKYKKAISELCKTIIEEEEFPTCFRQTILYMKHKGAIDVFKNNRFWNMNGVYARTVDALVERTTFHAISCNHAIMQSLGTKKKSRNLSVPKKSRKLSGQKITQPLGTKKS